MKLVMPLVALLATATPPAGVQFTDIAADAGLADIFYDGDNAIEKYIIETLGTGLALIDYDSDGYPDLFVVNGSRLEGFPAGREPTNHLYRNNRDGTFIDFRKAAGLERSGWGRGVCAGDFDNDGYTDLFITCYGTTYSIGTRTRACSKTCWPQIT